MPLSGTENTRLDFALDAGEDVAAGQLAGAAFRRGTPVKVWVCGHGGLELRFEISE